MLINVVIQALLLIMLSLEQNWPPQTQLLLAHLM